MIRSFLPALATVAVVLGGGAQAATVAQGATLVGAGGDIEPTTGTEIASDNPAYSTETTTPASDWVWVDDAETTNAATFAFVFDLSGFVPGTASLSGLWGVDNQGSVSLNGTELAAFTTTTTATFSSLSAYGTSVPGLFNPGTNTLTFALTDDGGQAAFRATATVTATPVPVPASLSLALAGVLALGVVRAARRRA